MYKASNYNYNKITYSDDCQALSHANIPFLFMKGVVCLGSSVTVTDSDGVCVCMCVCERVRERVRERACVRACVCVCVCVCCLLSHLRAHETA